MDAEAKIVSRGKSDYYAFKGKYANPYPPASAEFNHYERGWMQSLKFDEGKLISPTSFASRAEHSQAATASAVNQYALMKGRGAPLKKP